MCVLCLTTPCVLGNLEKDTSDPEGIVTTSGSTSTAPVLSTEPATVPTQSVWKGLLSGSTWSGAAVTFGFGESAADFYGPHYSGYNEPSAFLSLSTAGKNIVRAAFGTWADIVTLGIGEAASGTHPQINVGGSSIPDTAWAYYPGSYDSSGDVWFGVDKSYFSKLVSGTGPYLGSYEYATALHEIGHALGLKHPHQGSTTVPAAYDGLEYSVMSYRSYLGGPASYYTVGTWSYPQSLMMLDIAAIQDLYGADFSTLSANTIYRFDPLTGEMTVSGVSAGVPGGNVVFRTLWDGNGTDTIDLSAYATDLAIDLNPGKGIDLDVGDFAQRAQLSSSVHAAHHIYMSLLYNGDTRSLIENATGGIGDDVIVGNQAANLLSGRAGADTVTGGLGADKFVLGSGADTVTDTLAGLDGDTIADFDLAEDLILVKGTTLTASKIAYSSTTGLLAIDSNGDGTADSKLSIGTGLGTLAPVVTAVSGGSQIQLQAVGPAAVGQLEAGTEVVTQTTGSQWFSVSFSQAIPDACVVMGPVSLNNWSQALVRVRNVTDYGFEFQIDEWDYLDGKHPAESVSWVAASAGSYTLASGQAVTFGHSSATDAIATSVTLSGFGAAPAVFTQVTSANDAAAVVTRTSGVSKTGFSVHLQEQESADQKHATESFDWMAIDYGTTGAIDAALTSVSNSIRTVSFDAVTDELVFLASMQTEKETDPAALRLSEIGTSSAKLLVQEERSFATELKHAAESVATLTLSDGVYDLYA